mmetsp:Transcript_22965/g.74821  ORF Transcript_22965/g.74821 Transcript_22965/m.74821 type:complete len:350 (+) Transcript_22965:79-1128(+)
MSRLRPGPALLLVILSAGCVGARQWPPSATKDAQDPEGEAAASLACQRLSAEVVFVHGESGRVCGKARFEESEAFHLVFTGVSEGVCGTGPGAFLSLHEMVMVSDDGADAGEDAVEDAGEVEERRTRWPTLTPVETPMFGTSLSNWTQWRIPAEPGQTLSTFGLDPCSCGLGVQSGNESIARAMVVLRHANSSAAATGRVSSVRPALESCRPAPTSSPSRDTAVRIDIFAVMLLLFGVVVSVSSVAGIYGAAMMRVRLQERREAAAAEKAAPATLPSLAWSVRMPDGSLAVAVEGSQKGSAALAHARELELAECSAHSGALWVALTDVSEDRTHNSSAAAAALGRQSRS